MMEQNGKYEYSPVAIVNFNEDVKLVTIYPNPFNDKIIIHALAIQQGSCTVTIRDIFGKTVFEEGRAVYKGNNTLRIDNLQQLSAGTYQVTFNVNGQYINTRLVK
jgi:hypothetical protein